MSITTTDYSVQGQFPTQEKYLINTSKIVKGHKLTLKDTIRRQLMKSRASSQTRKQQEVSSQVITEYTEKYHALETIEDQQYMMRFIAFKRFRQSRASQRGIKMFSRQTVRPKTTVHQSPRSSQFPSARNAKTSHSKRSHHEKESKHSTLTYQIHNSVKDNVKKPSIYFSSENIDPRMTQCLNMILKKKEKDQICISELQLKQMIKGSNEKQDFNPKMLQIRNSRNRSVNNSFLRQMKKHHSSRAKNNQSIENGCGSDELVKSLKRNNFINSQLNKNDKSSYSTIQKSISNYYSIEPLEDSSVKTKRNNENKFQKSYMSSITPKTFEYEPKGINSANNSARHSFY